MKFIRSRKLWIVLLAIIAPLALLGAEKQELCLTFCEEPGAVPGADGPARDDSAERAVEMNANTPSKQEPTFWAVKLANQAEAFVCNLAPAEQVERREAIRSDILSRTLSRERTEEAWVLAFADEPGLIATLAEYIQLEQACCSFLRFEMIVEPHGAGTQLKLGGEPEALDFISGFMDDVEGPST